MGKKIKTVRQWRDYILQKSVNLNDQREVGYTRAGPEYRGLETLEALEAV